MFEQKTEGFGPVLKRFREARRVSQSKLAERAGFDHSYVSRLESGARLTATTHLPLSQVARRCGFSSAETFRQAFVAKYGVSPRAFRATQTRP